VIGSVAYPAVPPVLFVYPVIKPRFGGAFSLVISSVRAESIRGFGSLLS
jgi:hypothetical protein